MSKHTPGPWSAEYVEQEEIYEMTGWVVNVSPKRFITVEGRNSTEAAANARLIAAAPDLLEALEAVMEGSVWEEARTFVDGTPLTAGWTTKRMPTDDALSLARSAIARAKGEVS